FLQEGNTCADALTAPAWAAPLADVMTQAVQSHAFFHQGAHALSRQFHLPMTAAHSTVASCSDCQHFTPPAVAGVNPRGLQALQLWQSDVTPILKFGRLKYVHVSVDIFSGA
ncbi:POK7 protein, partial [Geococcyx californianus]|nr:POK7 protein [Geococcyx californianus]